MLTELHPAEAALPQEVILRLKAVHLLRDRAVPVPAVRVIQGVQAAAAVQGLPVPQRALPALQAAAAVQGLQVPLWVLRAARVHREARVLQVVQDREAAQAPAVEEGINRWI